MSLHLAYDGSINGDWVARYAINLARRITPQRLRIIHVQTGEVSEDRLREQLARIERECRSVDVDAVVERVPVRGTMLDALMEAVPPDAHGFLVCGTRVRSDRRGYLSGTVAEKLLGKHRCNVMAVRVVQPGILGVPRDVLVSVPGPATALHSSLPFLRLLAAEVRHLHILRAIRIGRSAHLRLTPERLSRLRGEGRTHAETIEGRLVEETALTDRMIDAGVRITDDWVGDTIVYASRHKSQLICVEAPLPGPTVRLFRADPIERLLADAPCDVAVFRGA